MIEMTRSVVKRISYDASKRLHGPVWDAGKFSLEQLLL